MLGQQDWVKSLDVADPEFLADLLGYRLGFPGEPFRTLGTVRPCAVPRRLP
jgi:hypothetical protein